MNIQQASEILELEMIQIVDIKIVKKQYHKLALQNHPDKNGNTEESNQKFKKINEAYFYLKDMNDNIYSNASKSDNDEEDDHNDDIDFNDNNYLNILKVFIQNIIQCSNKDAVFEIIKDIVVSCKQIPLKLFEGLDKYVCIEIYEFITKYKTILHISQDTIDNVKIIILEKIKNDQIYILNPSINDLFENNIYKISILDETYLVPLWHNELYFDGKDGEIIVKCIPDLPENVTIDEHNNLTISLDIQLTQELLDKPSIHFYLGDKCMQILLNHLNLQKSQIVLFKRQGISQINDSDMYNVSVKADIIAIINLFV
jgi:hypothetical protein